MDFFFNCWVRSSFGEGGCVVSWDCLGNRDVGDKSSSGFWFMKGVWDMNKI